ncbi:hypothetical protein F3Y22_tig00004046pilonHSYRG00090 [Hibiscus syriacus]|uniref:Uncharacterized protein n=1 Tax=Hibiscus syriacus TaxID=106335 RepID=A0A6A3CJJ6_HIBSY|nr:uncharacterized protein LOC120188207 [Hibiscus syriacus]KAE8728887.1 hypothetical protein F3Y22_tig00004046pilonHSYRG00090 [Hibiscus syriacus]
MAASAMASGTLKLLCSAVSHRRMNSASRVNGYVKFLIDANNRSSTTSFQRSFPIRAVDSQTDEENPSFDEPNSAFITQEDVSYMWKLGGGSVVGAAIIKYGSILFPELTRPNIIQALIMILTPVIIAVLLLIKGSRVKQ